MTTITIERPEAPKVLPEGHSDRRPKRLIQQSDCVSGAGVKTGTTRYISFERQQLAAAYHEDRRQAKLLRAYHAMSRFELMQLIKRLEQRRDLSDKLSKQDSVRLDVAHKALKERTEAGFELPMPWDIPNSSSVSYRRLFLDFGISEMTARLKELGKDRKTASERDELRKGLVVFEEKLASLGGFKPKAKVEDTDNTESTDDHQPAKKKARQAGKKHGTN